ncbi:MAG: M48 family metallopeptidase [Alphaproteobacteria bacterium]|nr:M48 family metallopeptidase [Alphaproteobacteria bacterium]MCB9928318.1 M48 family metallopeptidase [Alphaproteobacteria bacterium]
MREVPPDLTIRVDGRARRISLRLNARGAPVLTLPHARLKGEGLRFVAAKRDWLAAQRARTPEPVPFRPGAVVPVAGAPHEIALAGRARDPVRAADGVLHVGGREETVPALVTAWLKAEARRTLVPAVARHCERLGQAPPPLAVRDPKSRWGSCSSARRLSFSWRLAMAPIEVLDYVAAHEVAHLVELNHSARFWALVAQLTPGFEAQEAWLKRHGRGLHRYG